MNIFKIAFANIRKRKGASITFFSLVVLSALMLSISLSLIFGTADFYDKKSDELNAPHYTASIAEFAYKSEFLTYAENYSGVAEYNGKKAVTATDTLLGVGVWKTANDSIAGTTSFLNEQDRANSFYNSSVIDGQSEKPENMVILPVSYKFSFGAKSGEKISFEISGKGYEFIIYGFYEDAVSGPSSMWQNTAYIGSGYFNGLYDNDDFFFHYKTLTVRFEKAETHLQFSKDFSKFVNLSWTEFTTISFDETKNASQSFIGIASAMLLVFSLVTLLTAFIVAAFSIATSIRADIAIIGTLKSIGYKTQALRNSQLIQYLLIAAAGSIIGSLISLLTFGFLGDIVASMSGFLWLASVNIAPLFIAVFAICAFTVLVTYLVTQTYKKITPINALRQGEAPHSFKKNFLPLSKYKMPLSLQLGAKRFFTSIKGAAVLCVITALLIFVSSVVYVLKYNLVDDRTAMTDMMGVEMSDLWIEAAFKNDLEQIDAELKQRPELQGETNFTLLSGKLPCRVGGIDTSVTIVSDYSKLLIKSVAKGAYPELKNEITLGATTARQLNKVIGDTVAFEINDEEKSYIVTGITQNLDGGTGCSISFEGFANHYSDTELDTVYAYDTIYVYLNDGVNYKNYESKLKNIFGSRLRVVDIHGEIETIFNSLSGIVEILSIVMIAVTLIVIAFVLFLTINSVIVTQKREFGIMKAMGYKNGSLILQLLISFLPALLLGTIGGIALGLLFANPLTSAVLAGLGVYTTAFIIPIWQSMLIGIGILGAGILTTLLISLRLYKLSPQKLIVET